MKAFEGMYLIPHTQMPPQIMCGNWQGRMVDYIYKYAQLMTGN
jgi:hypothetical protein